MMGPRQVAQGALFYEFSIEGFVPLDHPVRGIDRFLDLSHVRPLLAPFYSSAGRPSIDPELMIRMLLLGYCMGIRSERRLCEEVHVNLAYRWFCRLDLTDAVPDHSTFSKNRHGRFRESGLFRHLFETVLQRCMDEGLVGGHSFGVDASLIPANANQTRGIDSKEGLPPDLTSRAVGEYLETLDDAAFGAATDAIPKYISPVDPAARWTGADGGAAYFAYSTNYLVDLDNAVIVDVEPTAPIRPAEARAARDMIDRVQARFGIKPDKLVGDTGYGSAEMLGWLVEDRKIAPHIPVWDKSKRTDGTFSREDFAYDTTADRYTWSFILGTSVKRLRVSLYKSANDTKQPQGYRFELAAPRYGATVTTRLNMIAGMRQSLPDLQGIAACVADGATYFTFQNCELRYWPDGHIEVVGRIDAETANRLADAVADVLQSELTASDLDLDGPADNERHAFDPF